MGSTFDGVWVVGAGQTEYAKRGGYGTIAEAFSGIPSFTGFPDRPPTLPGFPMADSVASTFAAMSAMFAVYNRDHNGGRGQEIDVSLYEPLFRLVESQVIGFDQLGIVKKRQGNRLAEDSPRNTYETRDGRWIGISASWVAASGPAIIVPASITRSPFSGPCKGASGPVDTGLACAFIVFVLCPCLEFGEESEP